jgi:uncharacterized protein YkwD
MPTSLLRPAVLLFGLAVLICTIGSFPFSTRLFAAPGFTGCGGERPPATNAEYEAHVASLINQERAAQGLSPVQHNADLRDAARYHAVDMMQDDYFEHDSFDLVDGVLVYVCKWSERVRSYYPVLGVAENIAWGYANPEAVVQAWMDSEGHRRNILGSSWEIGVGFHNNVWVVDFSRQRDVFPLIINRGADATSQRTVVVYIYGDWSEMRLRNDDGDWSDWQPFQHEFDWQLADLPGLRRVEAELRGGAASATTGDEIELTGPTNSDTPTVTPTLLTGTTPTDTETPTPTLIPNDTPTPTPTATLSSTTPPICTTCVDLQVQLEGRPEPPHPRWVMQLVTRLTPQGQTDPPVLTYTRLTSITGLVRLNNVPPGPYELLVKGAHTLQRRVALTVTPGLNRVEAGLLHEGDIHVNNRVDLLDFSLLSGAYGDCGSAEAFRGQADLDGDNCITGEDLYLLRTNFGLVGDEPATLSAGAAASTAPSFTIHSKASGDHFALILAASETAGGPVDAGALYLNFDATLMRAVRITSHPHFTTTLQYRLDNLQGQVDFAAGILRSRQQPPFEFARITFEALQPFDQSTITLETSAPRRTELAANGDALSERTPGGVAALFTIEEQEAAPEQSLFLPLVQK